MEQTTNLSVEPHLDVSKDNFVNSLFPKTTVTDRWTDYHIGRKYIRIS